LIIIQLETPPHVRNAWHARLPPMAINRARPWGADCNVRSGGGRPWILQRNSELYVEVEGRVVVVGCKGYWFTCWDRSGQPSFPSDVEKEGVSLPDQSVLISVGKCGKCTLYSRVKISSIRRRPMQKNVSQINKLTYKPTTISRKPCAKRVTGRRRCSDECCKSGSLSHPSTPVCRGMILA